MKQRATHHGSNRFEIHIDLKSLSIVCVLNISSGCCFNSQFELMRILIYCIRSSCLFLQLAHFWLRCPSVMFVWFINPMNEFDNISTYIIIYLPGWWFGTFGLFFPSYWEFHNPNWRTPSFFRRVGWNHQPATGAEPSYVGDSPWDLQTLQVLSLRPASRWHSASQKRQQVRRSRGGNWKPLAARRGKEPWPPAWGKHGGVRWH